MTDSTLGVDHFDAIDRYCDVAPRPTSEPEDIGPFTLFVATGAFPYYARPRIGVSRAAGLDDVKAVRARQLELGVPERFEWIVERAPGLADVLEASGLLVERRPLLVWDGPVRLPPPSGVRVELVQPDSSLDEWARAVAVVDLGFSTEGTEVGASGSIERDALVAQANPERLAYFKRLAEAGLIRWAVAEDGSGPVGGGSYHPREVDLGDGGVHVLAEVTGVATMPSMRRRGVGAALVCALVEHARTHGVEGLFMAATDDAVARVYERAGFRRIGTSCEASAPSGSRPS